LVEDFADVEVFKGDIVHEVDPELFLVEVDQLFVGNLTL